MHNSLKNPTMFEIKGTLKALARREGIQIIIRHKTESGNSNVIVTIDETGVKQLISKAKLNDVGDLIDLIDAHGIEVVFPWI